MTSEIPGPDQLVSTALQLLPIPEHGADFWMDLEASLAAIPSPGAAPVRPAAAIRRDPATEVVPLVELQPVTGVVPPAMRRRSNLVLSAVAVAAAVMVVVAGTTLVRQRSADDAAELASDAGASTTTLASLVAPEDGGPAAEAVVSWLHSLADGDLGAAWAALGPASKHHWQSKDAFVAEASGFAEGYGAWAAATPDTILVTSLTASGDGEIVVVTLIGTVQQEGSAQQRADAFPVRVVDGKGSIELYAYEDEIEIVVPEPLDDDGTRPPVEGDGELIIVVPEGVDAPLIRLDDGATLVCGEAEGTELTLLEGGAGQRCGYTPASGIPAGDRVLTVAYLSADGTSVAAESVLFKAA